MLKRVGKIWKSETNGWVYSATGICPALCCGAHSGVQPKIMEVYEDGDNDTGAEWGGEAEAETKRKAMNCPEGIVRTLLATYHKIGCYNVFEKGFMAVIEYEDDITDTARMEQGKNCRRSLSDNNNKRVGG